MNIFFFFGERGTSKRGGKGESVDFDYENSIFTEKADNLFSDCKSVLHAAQRAVWRIFTDRYTRSIMSVAALYSRSFRFEWKSNQGPLSVANNEFR